jgi:hypothetical protein
MAKMIKIVIIQVNPKSFQVILPLHNIWRSESSVPSTKKAINSKDAADNYQENANKFPDVSSLA